MNLLEKGRWNERKCIYTKEYGDFEKEVLYSKDERQCIHKQVVHPFQLEN